MIPNLNRRKIHIFIGHEASIRIWIKGPYIIYGMEGAASSSARYIYTCNNSDPMKGEYDLQREIKKFPLRGKTHIIKK